MDDLTATQVGVLFGLLVATLISGLAPIPCLARPSSHVKRIVSFCNCFAGGVFLATFLLHIMPEAAEVLDDALDAFDIHTHFPLSPFLVAVGFFLILTAEISVHVFYHQPETTPNNTADGGCTTHGGESRRTVDERTPLTQTTSHGEIDDTFERILSKPAGSMLSSLFFLVALSLHSVFEGLAIGLQDSISGVVNVLVGVVLHKCVIVLSFSLNLVCRKTDTWRIVCYVGILAVMSPIGVAVGIAIGRDTPSATMANGVLQSIAAGTFIFIVFFEILPDELLPRNAGTDALLKMVFLVIGFGMMTGLQFLHDDH